MFSAESEQGPFTQMIRHLRSNEEVILYANLLNINEKDQEAAIAWLFSEYENESLNYPFSVPAFNENAAFWAGKTVYIAAQLMLYREHKEADLNLLLPPYTEEITPSAILSADITMRFLPSILTHLKMIDPEDRLIGVLEEHLHMWHFSGINYPLNTEQLQFDTILTDKCLHQLYVNRVITNKKMNLACHPALTNKVRSSMSVYADYFWKDFRTETFTTNE